MARLRKGVAYRSLERPYTRYSKFRKKSYIRATPNIKVVKFDMGNLTRKFNHQVDLITKDGIQVRQEGMEAARRTCNRHLEKSIGRQNFHFKIRVFPFHVLRENPIAKGAGADRFSTGMSHSFGKPVGMAAQVKAGQKLFTVYTTGDNVRHAMDALKKANYKLPCACRVQSSENK